MDEGNRGVNPAGESENAEQLDKTDEVRKRTVELLTALVMGEREAEVREFQKLRQLPPEPSAEAGDAAEAWNAMPQAGRMFQVGRLQDDGDASGDGFPLDDLDELSFF